VGTPQAFLSFFQPHEARVYNLARLYAGEEKAVDLALDFSVLCYHRWQAVGGRMSGEEVYRGLWHYLRKRCKDPGNEGPAGGIAGMLRRLPPQQRMMVLLRDVSGEDYTSIARIMETGRSRPGAVLSAARRRLLQASPEP
jgi:DNA-directed RNA polymerase specialized sigma24 family protein